MGITNVLKKHETVYEAARLMAEYQGLRPEHAALMLLARFSTETGGDFAAEIVTAEGGGEVRFLKEVFPIVGNQFQETFDVGFDYGDYLAGGEDNPLNMSWEFEVAGRAATELESSMDEAVMAAIIFQGEAIIRKAKIRLFK